MESFVFPCALYVYRISQNTRLTGTVNIQGAKDAKKRVRKNVFANLLKTV